MSPGRGKRRRDTSSEGGDWGATAEVPERPEVDFLFPTMVAMADAVEKETKG